jgi:hypothetical protein
VLRLADDEIFQRFDAASDVLREGRPLLTALNDPPPGPYALFHHRGHALERVRDVRLLYARLLDAQEAFTQANERIAAERPENWPGGVPYPAAVSDLMNRAEEIRREMKVDYEGMFHFGSVLLDQFAYVCLYLAGVPDPTATQHPFNALSDRVEQEAPPVALRPIREHLLRHMRWLHFWMRTYRNRFVVHTDHPVQLGTVGGVYGGDFSLFTPTAVGWNDDEAVAEEMRDLFPHAPEWLQRADPGYWERARPRALFQRVIENIGNIDRQADRQRIANLAKRAGLQTPTFQVMASVLADFIGEGTRRVEAAALTAPGEINVGRSPHHP